MSRSFYKVSEGLAQVITTGEPVFVLNITNDTATVVRPVAAQTGIEYREETFPVDQLETRFSMAKRNIEFEKFVNDLRLEAQNKEFALPKQMKLALESISKQNGDQPTPTYRNANGSPVIVEG